MKLCDIFEELIEKELDLGKLGKLVVQYRPDFFTPYIEQVIARDSGNGKVRWLMEMTHRLFASWELFVSTEEEAAKFGAAVGEMVPLHEDALVHIPAGFLAVVFNAFIEQVKADPKNANSSDS